jgi:DNA polymerase III psi subunit
MEHADNIRLSSYQRATLTEMGISSWLIDDKELLSPTGSVGLNSQNQVMANNTSSKPVVAKNKNSQEQALARLQKLKSTTLQKVSTDSVLVTWEKSDITPAIFEDVLLALDMDTMQHKHIQPEQIIEYCDQPLVWLQGEKVNFKNNQLTSPSLNELQDVQHKKQLWQQLQRHSNKTNY